MVPTFVLGEKVYTCPFQALETKPQKFGDVDRIPEKINRKGWKYNSGLMTFHPVIFIRDLATSLYPVFTSCENLSAEYRISGRNMIGRIVPFAEPVYKTRISLSGDLEGKLSFGYDLKEGFPILKQEHF